MKIAARHEKVHSGWVYGTLTTTARLSGMETVFSLFLDDKAFSGIRFAIEQLTLSDLCEEAARLGLSDIQPDIG